MHLKVSLCKHNESDKEQTRTIQTTNEFNGDVRCPLGFLSPCSTSLSVLLAIYTLVFVSVTRMHIGSQQQQQQQQQQQNYLLRALGVYCTHAAGSCT